MKAPIVQPTLSRTPSTNTITQSRALGQHPSGRISGFRSRQDEDMHIASHDESDQFAGQEVIGAPGDGSPDDPASSGSSSSLSNSGHDNFTTRSQLFRKPPRFKMQTPRELITYEEDVHDSESIAYDANDEFPFAKITHNRQAQADNVQTDRQSLAFKGRHDKVPQTRKNNQSAINESTTTRPARMFETGSSTASSAHEPSNSGLREADVPLSKQQADTTRISSKNNMSKARKEGSEGAPSMGSSFSDIDGTYS